MTMVEITAIIATGILGVLCIICIASVIRNERQTNENRRAIKGIEKSLSTFGDSIKEQTEQLIEHLEKQQTDDANGRRLELLEEEIRQLSRMEEEAAAAAEALAAAGANEEIDEFGEIEELDDEIDLDDLFIQLSAMDAAEQGEFELPEVPVQTPIVQEPVIDEPAVQPAPVVPQQPLPVQPQPAPAEPEPVIEEPRTPTRYHQGYNIGRSGRKYTAEELNVLIRE